MSWLSIKPAELNVKARQLDGLFWSSIAGRTPQIRKLLPRRVDKVAGGDIFNALYQWEPTLRDDPPDSALAAWLEQTMKEPKFKELRTKTVGDRHVAAGATLALYRELMRPQDSPLKSVLQIKHHLDQMEAIDAEHQEQAQQQAQEQAEASEGNDGKPEDSQGEQGQPSNEQGTSQGDASNDSSQPRASTGQSSSQQAQGSGAATLSPAIQAIKNVQQQLAESLRRDGLPEMNKYGRSSSKPEQSQQSQAIENTLADLEVTEELSAFDQGSQGSSLDSSRHGAKVLDSMTNERLIGKITANDELRRIFKVAGRMRVILLRAKSKKPREGPPPVGLTFGSDIGSLVSSELAALADPELEDLFWLKWLDNGLLQYERKDKVNEGQGPFICCVDISGSMRGQPLEHAWALFVSLARLAVEKRRKIVLIPFASYAGEPQYIESGSQLIAAMQRTYRNLGGGTVFQRPLEAAVSVIEGEAQYKNADVLFVTDGDGSLNASWIEAFTERKAKLGYRLIGINVRGRWRTAQIPMFDATASMGSSGEVSKLEWLDGVAERMV